MDHNLILASGGSAQAIQIGWLSWIIVGLIAGALAKLILPGKQGGGFWVTLLVGLVGAIIGGLIATLFGLSDLGFWNIWTWVFSIGGAIIVLVIWGFIAKSRGKKSTTK